jgi:ABC-type nitrate/sulfonate/bicarbonate transport system ATPase subunit
MIEIKHITKQFKTDKGDTITPFKDLSFTLNEGDLNVVLGKTGCGKTTLLHILGGLESVTTGEVVLPKTMQQQGDIAYVFQEYSLLPWRTVIDNVALGLEISGRPEKERYERASAVLEDVQLSKFKDAYPHELSGGMRQRTAIAQALVVQPKLLLMDEPFSALDSVTRRDIQNMFIRLWEKEKFTTVFVTHSIEEALLLGNKILVMGDTSTQMIDDLNWDVPYPRDIYAKEFREKSDKITRRLENGLRK